MSFFTTEKKRLEEQVRNASEVGPGVYHIEQERPEHRNYAPFGSLSKDRQAVKNNKQDSIGPGSYEIQGNLMKPSVQHFQNENCIIIKINDQGTSQFKSGKKRFGGNGETLSPGPGSYNAEVRSKSRRNNRAKCKSGVIKIEKIYDISYLRGRKPTLASDPIIVPEKEVVKEKMKVKGVMNWGLNRKQRFHSQPKENWSEEDKSRAIDKIQAERNHIKANKESSFFASKSVKSYFDQIIYKSTNPYKVELRKMLGFDDTAPGPGSYHVEERPKHREEQFQFFGSTSNRFQETTDATNDIGPGYYEGSGQNMSRSRPELRLKKNKNKEKEKMRFNTEMEDENVGPGSYDVEGRAMGKPSFNSNYKSGGGNFGSIISRFQDRKHRERNLKPQYVSFVAQEDEERKVRIEEEFNHRRNILRNRKQPVFLSQSKRNCFMDSQFRTRHPFGNYEVGAQDISNRLRKQKEHRQQFWDCQLSKPGFSSSVERFKSEEREEEGHKDCWCRMKEVEKKSIQHESHVFNSGAKRTEIFEVKHQGPGVGEYDRNSTMIKDSFNSKFIKMNQNQRKKMMQICKDH